MSLLGRFRPKPGRGRTVNKFPKQLWGSDDAPRQHPSQVTDPSVRLHS